MSRRPSVRPATRWCSTQLVQDDDAGPRAQRLDDPAVRVRVVAEVVERDVGAARRPLRPRADDLDVDPLAQRGQQQRAVVGDPRALRRERRVVGDLHARRLAEQRGRRARPRTTRSATRGGPAGPTARAPRRGGSRQPRAAPPRPRVGVAAPTTRPVRRSATTSSGPPASRGRDHRLLGEERLVRDHPEVLVHGRVEDRQAARVEVGELLVVDPAGEADAAVEALAARELLEALAVRPVADDDALRPGRARPPPAAGRPAWRGRGGRRRARSRRSSSSGTAAPAAGAAATSASRPSRAAQALGDVARDREDRARLAERDAVEPVDCAARARCPPADSPNWPSSVRSSSYACRNWCTSHTTLLGWRTAYEGNFVAITRSIGRPSDLLEVEQAPEERLRQHARAGIPVEGHGDEVGLVVARPELLDERLGEDLGAAARERHLRRADGDSHRRRRGPRSSSRAAARSRPGARPRAGAAPR